MYEETKFESGIREIPYSQQAVYRRLSDLNNMEKIKGRLPADKAGSLSFDTDTVSVSVAPVGAVTLRITGREEPTSIKFTAERTPLPFNMWIQLLPVTSASCKMRITIKTELNPFIKGMVAKPLQEGLDKMAETLAAVNYGENA